MWAKQKQPGFTIVELLIVIVVIAILAAITIVAYNGIQNRAHDTAVQNDLRQSGVKINQYYVENTDTLPAANSGGLGSLGMKLSKNSYGSHYVYNSNNYNVVYCWNSTPGLFALVANSKSGKTFVFRDGGVKQASAALVGSATTCADNGVASASAYWLYGHNGTNEWASWI